MSGFSGPPVGASGNTVPLLNGINAWSGDASVGGNQYTTPTTNNFAMGVFNTSGAAASKGIRVGAGPNSADSTSVLIQFTDSGQNTIMGSVSRNGAAAVAFNISSDRRLKENIAPTAAGLEALMRIEVVDFNFINDGTRVQGFIAQDLNEIYPVAVHAGGDVKTDPWQADYGRLTPLLVKAVQDLALENEGLKARLTALEGR